jgi:hypothetical protein
MNTVSIQKGELKIINIFINYNHEHQSILYLSNRFPWVWEMIPLSSIKMNNCRKIKYQNRRKRQHRYSSCVLCAKCYQGLWIVCLRPVSCVPNVASVSGLSILWFSLTSVCNNTHQLPLFGRGLRYSSVMTIKLQHIRLIFLH